MQPECTPTQLRFEALGRLLPGPSLGGAHRASCGDAGGAAGAGPGGGLRGPERPRPSAYGQRAGAGERVRGRDRRAAPHRVRARRRPAVSLVTFTPAEIAGARDVPALAWRRGLPERELCGRPADCSGWTRGGCEIRRTLGGSWPYHPWSLRSASNGSGYTGYRDNSGGFRVARTLVPCP